MTAVAVNAELGFALLTSLGIARVPHGHNSRTHLADFRQKYPMYGNFPGNGGHVTDKNYPNPSHVLQSGEWFNVEAYHCSEDIWSLGSKQLEYLKSLPGNVFLGAQGLVLVFDQIRERLLKGYSYLSHDIPDRLYTFDRVHRMVPMITRFKDTDRQCPDFTISCIARESSMEKSYAFLGFTQV